MISRKLRLRFLEKLAQAGQPPANETTGPTTVSGSPTKCDILVYFPSLIKAWGSNNLTFIQGLVDSLNEGIFVLSQGQVDFNKLRAQQFNVDAGKYPDRVLKNIVKFSQSVYNSLLTEGGKEFSEALTPEAKKSKITQLNGALGTSGIPDGVINQFLSTRVGGNLKSMITNDLSNIR